jgi:hypothetical protein
MRTYELTCLTHIPGQRIWCISRFGTKTDLIVTDVPDHLPQWDVTNPAMEAQYAVLPARNRQNDGTPTVTYKRLLEAKHGGENTIMLKPKIGRPPKDGIARDKRIDLWLTGPEKFYFEAMGGVTRVMKSVERRMQENPYSGMQKPAPSDGRFAEDDSAEYAALQRLVLTYVPEAEREQFWQQYQKLSAEYEFRPSTREPDAEDPLQ